MKRTYTQRIKLEAIECGRIVFAKIKGYPPWPAKIVSREGIKYNVKYFGKDAQT